VTYANGVGLSFSIGSTDEIDGTSVVYRKPWRGEIRATTYGGVELVDGECIVTVTALRDLNALSDEVAIAASLRPVAGQPTAPPPPLPTPMVLATTQPLAVPSLVTLLEADFGGSDSDRQCGDANLDVAGAKATPGCHGVQWWMYTGVAGSDLSLTVSDFATPKDAKYQFGIEHQYMRQYTGTTEDTSVKGIPGSFFILTNNGQQCEAAFLDGNREFVLNASARGDLVAKGAQDAVRSAILQAHAAEVEARSRSLALGTTSG
jgi:hypothetical protein